MSKIIFSTPNSPPPPVQAGTGNILPETPYLVTIFLGFALSHYGPLVFFVTSHKK